MSIEDKIDEVDRLIGKQKDLLKDLRLFLLSPNQWMRVYKGRSEKYEQFQDIPLQVSIDKFKTDLEEVWKKLIETYMQEQDKKIDLLITQLGDYNTINVWADITREREAEW